jgi:hypothetical protein
MRRACRGAVRERASSGVGLGTEERKRRVKEKRRKRMHASVCGKSRWVER